MALPPDPSLSFEREVDENLRRDQLADFGKKYGKWIVLAVILFLGAIGGTIWYQSQQAAEGAAQSEALNKVFVDIASTPPPEDIDERLEALAGEAKGATRAAAMMTQAALALDEGNRDRAIEIYDALAGDDDLPDPYRDVSTIRSVMLQFDRIEAEEVIARLQPLAQPGHPYYGTAAELTAIAMLKLDRKDEAAQLFAAIAAEEGAPQTLRTRAVQMAASLGVDASAALPAQDN